MVHSSSIALYAMHKAGISRFKIDECKDFARYLLREYHYLSKHQKNKLPDQFRFKDSSSKKRNNKAMKLIERLFSSEGNFLGITGNNGNELGFSEDPSVAFLSYIRDISISQDTVYVFLYDSSKKFLNNRSVA